MTGNVAQQALGIGTASPYPQSFDGSGLLFWCALFAFVTVSCLSMMLGSLLASHLTRDRKLGLDAVAALRLQVFTVCVVTLMWALPEISYMVSYHEAEPYTLQWILSLKRALEAISVFPVIFWVGLFWVYYAEIILRLRNPQSKIWQDYKLASLKRFIMVVVLSAGLAASVTIGVAYR